MNDKLKSPEYALLLPGYALSCVQIAQAGYVRRVSAWPPLDVSSIRKKQCCRSIGQGHRNKEVG